MLATKELSPAASGGRLRKTKKFAGDKVGKVLGAIHDRRGDIQGRAGQNFARF
jgi:hypothetical protein